MAYKVGRNAQDTRESHEHTATSRAGREFVVGSMQPLTGNAAEQNLLDRGAY